MLLRQPEPGVRPNREPEGGRRRELRPVLQNFGTDGLVMFLGDLVVRGDGLQALHWVGDVGRQRGEHSGHLVAPFGGALAVYGHRNHGEQGTVGKLATSLPTTAQGPSAECEHHVVDRGAEGVLDLLDGGKVDAGVPDAPVPGDGAVERGARRGERRPHGCAAAGAQDPITGTATVEGSSRTISTGRMAIRVMPWAVSRRSLGARRGLYLVSSFGRGASGSIPHNADIRLEPLTPSTLA